MKLKLQLSKLFLASFLLSLLSFASCKKCGHCTYNNGSYSDDGYTVCKKANVASKIAYDSEKNSCETYGGTWVTD